MLVTSAGNAFSWAWLLVLDQVSDEISPLQDTLAKLVFPIT